MKAKAGIALLAVFVAAIAWILISRAMTPPFVGKWSITREASGSRFYLDIHADKTWTSENVDSRSQKPSDPGRGSWKQDAAHLDVVDFGFAGDDAGPRTVSVTPDGQSLTMKSPTQSAETYTRVR